MFSLGLVCRLYFLGRLCCGRLFVFLQLWGDDFAGHSSLDRPLWLFKTGNALLEAFPAFKVSTEKSAVILIGLPLYVTCGFCRLTAFKIVSLFCILNVSTVIYWDFSFLVLSIWCAVWFFYLYKCAFSFICDLITHLVFAIDL